MKHLARILVCAVLGVGLAMTGTLFAAPQKIAKQRIKPVNKIDPATYKQKVLQLREDIRQQKQTLKASKQQFGKGSSGLKTASRQLRKDQKALRRLRKARLHIRKSPAIRKKKL